MAVLLALAALLTLFLLVSFLYSRLWEKGLETKLSFLDEYAVEDEEAELAEVVVNRKLLPLPALEIDFHMDRGLLFTDFKNTAVSDHSYRRDVFSLGARQKITRTLRFRCARRGYYQIRNAGICCWNLLLTKKYVSSQQQNARFYVLPRPVPAERAAIPFSSVMGSLLSRKRAWDDPFEFAGLRAYDKGDPIKYINWKATARTGELLVNMHESTLSQRVLVAVDLEGEGARQADLLNEEAVRVASSLCAFLLREGMKVDVLSNGTDLLTGKPLVVSGVSGAGSTLWLKKKFSCVQAGNGLLPVESLFPPPERGTGPLLVLISRDQREELGLSLSRRAGKEECVQIIPYTGEHPRLAAPGNLRRIWWEA